ncbi:MAG TPA: SpoIIE family protein phosphatase [Stellaceae bacterium]|nr:SpoIIE family protein phosphatase [Stellaceae bacterium]
MSSEAQPAGRGSPALRALLLRPGLIQALVVVAALLGLRLADPQFLDELALKGFDLEQIVMPRPQTDTPVIIVAIDEASLAPPWGQWPWPRTQMAALVQKIAAGRPSGLGVDIIFAEPDRFSPENLVNVPDLPPAVATALATMPSSDAALGAAFKSAPTVLGMGAVPEPPAAPQARFAPTPLKAIGGDPKPFLETFPAILRSLPAITAGETGRAMLVGNPDPDGIQRRVPLIVLAGGNIVPGLALETLRVATGERGFTVVSSPLGVEGVGLAGALFPTDGMARAFPHFARPQTTPTVSAGDVLAGAVDPARFTGKAVLLGVTGLGLVDLKQTPLGLTQGIEVQAQLLQSLLSGELLRRPAEVQRAEPAILLAVLLVVVFLLPYRRPLMALALLGIVVVACFGMEFASFRAARLLVDGIYPSLAAMLTFGVMLSANLRAAQSALERERDQRARLEGELSAARAIQMGLLPRPLPRVPETRSIDVHALIETARMVGGDLYDFVMLDPRRLFFAIADVSGKGVDAALFMAMTKMVFGGATVQHGQALDRVFGDANAKISSASDQTRAEGGRAMFVTVFAAVLELDTGAIYYASAGHDSPYLLRGGATPLRLDTEGGPPLGTLDDFDFPVDSAKLQPGDVLLLYTDGVTEAKNESGAFYTTGRLDALMASVRGGTAKSVVNLVREDVRQFVGSAEQADDITLLAVRWLGPNAPPVTAP